MSRARAVHRAPAAPRHPRRVSGPVARPVPVPGRPRPSHPVAAPGMGATLRALPDHRLLDTLLRSRAWIWLLGIALGGIVFMQVSLLQMNSAISSSIAKSADLEHSNALLSQQVATLASGERIQELAIEQGLISPDAGDVGFVGVRGSLDVTRALDRMTPPSDAARLALSTGGQPIAPVVPVEAVAPAETAVTPVAEATVAPVETVAPAATAAPPTEPVATAAPPTEYAAGAAGGATAP